VDSSSNSSLNLSNSLEVNSELCWIRVRQNITSSLPSRTTLSAKFWTILSILRVDNLKRLCIAVSLRSEVHPMERILWMSQQFRRKKHQLMCLSRVLRTQFMSRRLSKLKPVTHRRSAFSSKESMCKINMGKF